MTACTPSIHVFLGRSLFILSRGTHSIISFGILSSGILFTWPYHCSLFFSMLSMVAGFPFLLYAVYGGRLPFSSLCCLWCLASLFFSMLSMVASFPFLLYAVYGVRLPFSSLCCLWCPASLFFSMLSMVSGFPFLLYAVYGVRLPFSSLCCLWWPASLFFSMLSMVSGFPFTPNISFICSFFISFQS